MSGILLLAYGRLAKQKRFREREEYQRLLITIKRQKNTLAKRIKDYLEETVYFYQFQQAITPQVTRTRALLESYKPGMELKNLNTAYGRLRELKQVLDEVEKITEVYIKLLKEDEMSLLRWRDEAPIF